MQTILHCTPKPRKCRGKKTTVADFGFIIVVSHFLQLRHWQWLLDTALPGEFGQIGEWLNQGEALVYADDVPTHLNEEAAAILNQKIEDHKAFFRDLNSVQNQFANAVRNSDLVSTIPKEQLEAMARRLKEIGPKADVRAVRLKFLEHKVGKKEWQSSYKLPRPHRFSGL